MALGSIRGWFGGGARTEPPSIKAAFASVADRLMTLEINTIVKAGMSAQKMPEVPVTLHLIAGAYVDFLAPRLKNSPAPSADMAKLYDRTSGTNGADSFRLLSFLARGLIDRMAAAGIQDPEEVPKLMRIQTNSRQIAAALEVMARTPEARRENFDKFFGVTLDAVNIAIQDPGLPLPTTPMDFSLLVRKAWDMGTEAVIMQTSLQLDGDVMTRISPSMLDAPASGATAFSDAARGFIRTIHHDTTVAATSQWQTLFKAIGDLVGGLAKSIFPSR